MADPKGVYNAPNNRGLATIVNFQDQYLPTLAKLGQQEDRQRNEQQQQRQKRKDESLKLADQEGWNRYQVAAQKRLNEIEQKYASGLLGDTGYRMELLKYKRDQEATLQSQELVTSQIDEINQNDFYDQKFSNEMIQSRLSRFGGEHNATSVAIKEDDVDITKGLINI